MTQIELISTILAALDGAGVQYSQRVMDAVIALTNECVKPYHSAEPSTGLAAWLASDDTGLSSRYMAYICAGGPVAENHYPHDPSDFGRCYRLLQAFPNARENLYKLTDCGPVWARYVANWGEMERLYAEEFPTGEAPELYAMMRRLQEEHNA